MAATNKDLLYPAMHKLYSALRNLEQFQTGNNLFDNISYLDSFFSEYRNVTFMLQKSLKGTGYEEIYIHNRDKYLSGDSSRWFVEKRNEVLKQHPFSLEKRITITLYRPGNAIILSEEIFTVKNDIPIAEVIEELREFLSNLKPVEIFFSVQFSFYEEGTDKEIVDNIIPGVHNLLDFMNAMGKDIGEESDLCIQLHDKIQKFNFFRMPKEVLFTDDYVYYGQENRFEKAGGTMILLSENSTEKLRQPISNWKKMFGNTDKIDEFDAFVWMHAFFLGEQGSLMPTFFFIYEDDTFEIISYSATIKTVTYRKINEIAKKVKTDNIKQVFYATETLRYKIEDYGKIRWLPSPDREQYKIKEHLACYKLSKDGMHKTIYLDSEKIKDQQYVISVLLGNNNEEDIGGGFLQPIVNEFEF